MLACVARVSLGTERIGQKSFFEFRRCGAVCGALGHVPLLRPFCFRHTFRADWIGKKLFRAARFHWAHAGKPATQPIKEMMAAKGDILVSQKSNQICSNKYANKTIINMFTCGCLALKKLRWKLPGKLPKKHMNTFSLKQWAWFFIWVLWWLGFFTVAALGSLREKWKIITRARNRRTSGLEACSNYR